MYLDVLGGVGEIRFKGVATNLIDSRNNPSDHIQNFQKDCVLEFTRP